MDKIFVVAFQDELEKIASQTKESGLIGAGLGGLGGFLGAKLLGRGMVGKAIGTGVGALAGHGLTSGISAMTQKAKGDMPR